MLQYPETLANDPLVRFALEQLADGSLIGRVLYYASVPLGKVHTVVLRLQDHWETLAFLRAQLGLTSAPQHRTDLDWSSLLSAADEESRRKADQNAFGLENAGWPGHAPGAVRHTSRYAPEAVLHGIERNAEWVDADLLLHAIRDLGGVPLILSMPMNGTYYDYLGVPVASRRAIYDRLRELGTAYDVPVVDFVDHESDKYFTVDSGLHLSGKGWVYYDHALDAFFHGRQPYTL